MTKGRGVAQVGKEQHRHLILWMDDDENRDRGEESVGQPQEEGYYAYGNGSQSWPLPSSKVTQ